MSDSSLKKLSIRGVSIQNLRNLRAGPFTIDISSGECLVITGPSGAGKSIFLRMIADLEPHSGDVTLDGALCSRIPAHIWRRDVRYFPAESGWWSDSVLDHVQDDDRTRELMDRVALRRDILQSAVHRLSTGEKQRLALVRGLHRVPRVLLMDEPCSGLDEATTFLVEALIRDIMSVGVVVVLVSHDASQAARMSDTRYEMADGKFVRKIS